MAAAGWGELRPFSMYRQWARPSRGAPGEGIEGLVVVCCRCKDSTNKTAVTRTSDSSVVKTWHFHRRCFGFGDPGWKRKSTVSLRRLLLPPIKEEGLSEEGRKVKEGSAGEGREWARGVSAL